MDYEQWKTKFLSEKDITVLSLDDIMKFAFDAGANYVEENTPLVAKDIQTGELSIIAREKDLPSNLLTVSDDDDFDFGKYLKEKESK